MSGQPPNPRPMQRARDERFGALDTLKAVAAQLIVLHHLVFYGPMADHAQALAPALFQWLDTHGRLAVQAFLVMGGFLAARALCPTGVAGPIDPLRVAASRWRKLAPPLMAAVALAVLASALASTWMTHEAISAPPTVVQLLAHALLLQDVLGIEALSAGVWYVAIDFQLHVLLAALLWLAAQVAAPARPDRTGAGAARGLATVAVPVVVATGVLASLLHFNRDAAWDAWAPYFFGSYGLGALAWWASDPARRAASAAVLLASIGALPALALATDFRLRILVAVVTALVLVATRRAQPAAGPGRAGERMDHAGGATAFARTATARTAIRLAGAATARARALAAYLGRTSYALFLVHFPVCLVVNAAFTRFAPPQPGVQAAGMLVAWAASLAVAAGFHRWIERPLATLGRRRGPHHRTGNDRDVGTVRT